MRIYQRFCNAWPLILLAVFIVGSGVNLHSILEVHAQTIKAPDGFMTASDATAVNMRFAKYDSDLHSSCAHAIGKKMDANQPHSKASYTTTAYLFLHLPMEDSIDWAGEINYDFQVIDAVLSRCR